MALTLNSLGLTSTASGGGGSTGLTEANVNTLIYSKSDWEFIDAINIVANASTTTISTGSDLSEYDAFRYMFNDMRPSTTISFQFKLRNTAGDYTNAYSTFRHGQNTGYQNSNVTEQYINSQAMDTSHYMNFEFEVYKTTTPYISAYFRMLMGNTGGYWQNYVHGSYVAPQSSAAYNSIVLLNSYSSGVCRVYGRRKREDT